MGLGLLEPHFVVSNTFVEVLEEVRLIALLGCGASIFLLLLLDGRLECLDLALVLLNYFLAEVGPFGQLFLDLLVIRQISLQGFNHGSHLVVLEHEVLSLLGLVL